MRVVSLVPSLTETLFALGAGEAVVGITEFCIFPEGIDLPRVGGTKTPNIGRIRQLAPDIVYVNVEENLKRHANEIATFAKVIATEPKTIDDVAKLIEMLGANHGCEARAAELVAQVTGNRPLRSLSQSPSGKNHGCGAAAILTFRIWSRASEDAICCAIANAIQRSSSRKSSR
jgi:ABC-type hemin transport system substrate-binding protein